MIDSLNEAKDLVPFVTPFIPSIIDVFVKPKLQKLSKFLKTNSSNVFSIETKFAEYLERSYKKHSFLPILIFQNRQSSLEDIYIPLTVRTENREKSFLIDTYPIDFLPTYKKVLIRDTAGMGKSTLMKRLFLSCLESKSGIPVFIELRKLERNDSILNFICKELNSIDDEVDQDFISQLIKEGNFIFFFDGYDEISQDERADITQNIHNFISKTSNNLFIMTSRPETSLASFPDFMEFDIQPLKLEEAFSLLRKYDKHSNLSEEIISKLQGRTLESVKDFLKNPLLVSLLYKSYEYKPTIPLKKHNFYRQVFDALFESHDLTKEGHYIRDKYCQLDTDSFHAVLRSLGFLTLKYGIEYDKDQILAFIKSSKEQCSTIEFKESKFLDDLLQTVPIFTIEANKYRWSHKSLQDYFAAQFIWLDSDNFKTDILKKMVASEENQKYYNVLDLYYDMDFKTFRQVIIYEYLCEAIKEYELQPKVISKNHLTKDEIAFIKSNIFGQVFFIVPPDLIKKHKTPNLDMVGILKEVIEKKGFLLEGYTFSFWGVWKNEERLVAFTNCYSLITNLLSHKGESIFQVKKKVHNKLKKIKVKQRKGTLFAGFTPSLIIIEDDTSFNWIVENHLLPMSFSEITLDFDKCVKMKLEIEVEISKKDSNQLVDNL